MKKISILPYLLVWLLPLAILSAEETYTLTVDCTNVRPNEGQAILSLFTSKENFLKDPVREKTQEIGPKGIVHFELEGLSAGTYAVSVIYDEDGDGELDTGFMGIPSEPVGISNNAKGRFGPPSFDKAAFELTENLRIEIKLGKAK